MSLKIYGESKFAVKTRKKRRAKIMKIRSGSAAETRNTNFSENLGRIEVGLTTYCAGKEKQVTPNNLSEKAKGEG